MTKEERLEKKTKNRNNAKILLNFLKGSKRYFILGVIFGGLNSLADMLDPQIFRMTIDNAIGGAEADYAPWVMKIVEHFGGFSYLGKHLWIMAMAVVAVALVRVSGQYFNRIFLNRGSETLIKRMRDMLFGHIQRLPYAWHMENHTGDIIQRCTNDIEQIRNFIAEQLVTLVRLVILMIMAIYFMLSMNVKLTLIALIPLPLIFVFVMQYSGKMSAGWAKCDETEGVVSAMVQENLTGVRVVRAFGQEKKEKERFEEKNEYYTNLWKGMSKVMGKYWTLSDGLSGLQILLVVVTGCIMCVRGQLSSGSYVAFISYNAMMSQPIKRLGRIVGDLAKAGVALNRVAYIMNSEEEKDKEGAAEYPIDRDIRFEHINFGYEGCPQILHDIDFEIPAGSTLGILGGTGSGKSTLMMLLDKLYDIPQGCGRITIGGVDIQDIKTEHLRSNISLVIQEPYLYSRTLKENIGITKEGITIEEIKDAAKAACLDETIEGFAKGYDTFVGERGVTLSGGQKQRAAIARALTKTTPIMVFDDSLSAVDTQTDAKIRAALEERFGKATMILISHRITTLSKADKVLVLEDGRIAEFDTPQKLKTAGGIYQKIYDIQSGNIGKEA